MLADRAELISHLQEQRDNAHKGIQLRLAKVGMCSELDTENLSLLAEISELTDNYRVYRDLLSRLEERANVAEAYCGLMAWRLSNPSEVSKQYLKELGEEAQFAGLGPGARFGSSK